MFQRVFHVVHGAVRGGHVDILQQMEQRFGVFSNSCSQYFSNVVNLALHQDREEVAEWMVLHLDKDLRLLADTVIPNGSVRLLERIVDGLNEDDLNFLRQQRDLFAYTCAIYRKKQMMLHLQSRSLLPTSAYELCESSKSMHNLLHSLLPYDTLYNQDISDTLGWICHTFGPKRRKIAP